jgi:single-strand DNA-binding protein
MSDSAITLSGTLTRDFELKFLGDGTAVAQSAIAINERKLVNGEWTDGEASFYEVVAWRQLAENVAASLQKGNRIVVRGKLRVRDWQREDGSKGRSVEVVADDIAASCKWATLEVTKNGRSERVGADASAGRSNPSGYGPDATYEVGPGSDEPF